MIFDGNLCSKNQIGLSDLHVHSNFCDGKNTPEQLILSAIDKGLKTVGIVMHSHIPNSFYENFDCDDEFQTQMNALKIKYQDKIKVLCGLEMDILSTKKSGYDYIIGSVHMFNKNGKLFDVDRSKEYFVETVKNCFNGDYFLAVEDYFQNVEKVIKVTNADIIGHFDLITKFNLDNCLFDENDARYVNAWQKAVDKLIPYGKPFEINLGGIARNYKKTPYPSFAIMQYIKEKGGKFILTSDAHTTEKVAFEFEKWKIELEKFFD